MWRVLLEKVESLGRLRTDVRALVLTVLFHSIYLATVNVISEQYTPSIYKDEGR